MRDAAPTPSTPTRSTPTPSGEWWRTDEAPDLAEDPAALQQREREAKKPELPEVLRRIREDGPQESVDLTTMQLRDGAVIALCRALSTTTGTQRVYIGANYIHTRGWGAVAGVLCDHPTITRWSFPKTRLGRAGARALSEALYSSAACESVDMAGCSGVKEYGGHLLLTAVKHNTRITCLYVKDTDIPRHIVERIHHITYARRHPPALQLQ